MVPGFSSLSATDTISRPVSPGPSDSLTVSESYVWYECLPRSLAGSLPVSAAGSPRASPCPSRKMSLPDTDQPIFPASSSCDASRSSSRSLTQSRSSSPVPSRSSSSPARHSRRSSHRSRRRSVSSSRRPATRSRSHTPSSLAPRSVSPSLSSHRHSDAAEPDEQPWQIVTSRKRSRESKRAALPVASPTTCPVAAAPRLSAAAVCLPAVVPIDLSAAIARLRASFCTPLPVAAPDQLRSYSLFLHELLRWKLPFNPVQAYGADRIRKCLLHAESIGVDTGPRPHFRLPDE
jgi:hypothetical protein